MEAGFEEVGLHVFPYLLHPQPVAIVVSVDDAGRPNGMTASWIIPVSRNPPLLCVAIAPTRYTYRLIRSARDFTVNVLEETLLSESEYFGRVSGSVEDKFSKSRLTLGKSAAVKSPHILESVAVLECSLYREVEAGDHVIVIGKVEKAWVKKGSRIGNTYDPGKARILLHLGGERYTVPEPTIKTPENGK